MPKEDGPNHKDADMRTPSAPAEKSNNNNTTTTTTSEHHPPTPPYPHPQPHPQPHPHPLETVINIPRVNEVQLTAATGGAELSCYRCTIPFGVVVLIAGVVVTAVAYSFNSHGSTISYFGLVLLSAGVLLLALSAVCFKMRLQQKKERRRESQTALVVGQRSIFS